MAWKYGSSPLPPAGTTLVVGCVLAISYSIAEPVETAAATAAETTSTKAKRSEPVETDGEGAAPEPPLDTDTDTDTDNNSDQPEQSQAPAEAPAELENDPGEPERKTPNLYDSDLEDMVPVEPVEPEAAPSV